MIVLFGPCMFVAPLLLLLVPIALVLWPPTLVVLGVLWLVMWPFAAVGRRYSVRWLASSHAALGRWFVVLLRPWRYFDPPREANRPG
ncbi:MAG: hypothetical protein ACHQQR_11120 [Gemmatimonadales bacterium]